MDLTTLPDETLDKIGESLIYGRFTPGTAALFRAVSDEQDRRLSARIASGDVPPLGPETDAPEGMR